MDIASPNSISNCFVSETYQRNSLMTLKVEGCIPLLRLIRCGLPAKSTTWSNNVQQQMFDYVGNAMTIVIPI